MLSDVELDALELACRGCHSPRTKDITTDLVSTLLDTVIDYQQRTTTVVKAAKYFTANRWEEVRTLDDLETLFARFPNDKAGTLELGQYLWG